MQFVWIGISILVPAELREADLCTPSVPVSQQREREMLSMPSICETLVSSGQCCHCSLIWEMLLPKDL